VAANAPGKCIPVPDSSSLVFANQAVIMAALGGISSCILRGVLLKHGILSTRLSTRQAQDMLATLQKAAGYALRAIEHRKH